MGDTPSRSAQEAGNEATRLQATARGSGELAGSSAAVANANREAPRPGDGDRGAREDGQLTSGAPEAKREMNDCDILAALLGYLGKQAGTSLAVSSIFTSPDIPEELRELAADRESVLRWLGKFQGLLGVEGPEGHEEIVLLLGRSRPANGEAAAGPASGVPSPTSQAVGPPSPQPSLGTVAVSSAVADDKRASAKGSSANTAVGAAPAADKEDETANHATVQLRGLPFKATIADIKEFLGVHAQKLANSETSVRLLMNRDQRPSGFARVQFASAEAAAAAREALHKTIMGERYIEVLPCADRDRKARRGLRPAGEGESAAHGDTEAAGGGLGQLNEAEEQERVLQECREYMLSQQAGRVPVLLSSLGIALTQPARDYVHRLNLGLKHFLVKFNDEFRVEGPKGVEKVIWHPDRKALQQLPVDFGGGCLDVKAVDGPAAETAKEPSTPQTRILEPPRSGTGGTSGPSGGHRSGGPDDHFSTPSLWGTPGMRAANMEEGAWNGHWSQQNGWLGESGPVMEGLEGTMPWSNGWWPPQAANAWPSDAGGTEGKASAARRSHAHLHPKSHPFARGRIPGTSSTEGGATDFEGPAANLPAVRLRGLPFDLSGQDVLAFFAHHDVAGGIADGPNVVHMLPKANGRPSGQAVVQMRSLAHAEAAFQALNTKRLGNRYIEVFVYGANPTEADSHAMAPPGLPEFHQGALSEFAGVDSWPWGQALPPFSGPVLGPMGLGGGMVGPPGYPGLPGGLIDPAFDPAHTDIFEPCAGTAASQGGDMGASAGCTVGAAAGEGGGGNSSSVPAGPSTVTIEAV